MDVICEEISGKYKAKKKSFKNNNSFQVNNKLKFV